MDLSDMDPDLFETHIRSLSKTAALKFQGMIADFLAANVDGLVVSPEGGRNDIGLLAIPENLPRGPDAIFSYLYEKYGKLAAKIVWGIEVKYVSHTTTILRRNDEPRRGFHIGFTDTQIATTQAVIVGSPSDRNAYVAFVPMAWILQRDPRLRTSKLYQVGPNLPKTRFGFGKGYAFPEELAPFIMPLTRLPDAINEMRKHGLNPNTPW
jgi:hypothetical protein